MEKTLELAILAEGRNHPLTDSEIAALLTRIMQVMRDSALARGDLQLAAQFSGIDEKVASLVRRRHAQT